MSAALAGAAPVPRRANPYAAVAAALAGCFLASYHTRFIGMGLPDLRGALGLSFDEAAWLSTIANAPQMLTAPAVPWLVLAFGIRPILLWPGLAYALLVALIPLAREPATLMLLHGATALLLGLFVPATLLVVVRNLSPAWWLPAFAAYAFRLAFTLNSGPVLTGWMVQELGWAWLYWSDVPLALLMVVLAWWGSVPQPPNRALLDRADWGGMLLFGLGLTCIFIGLDQGNRLDWLNSGTIVALLAGGAALMLAFLLQEAISPHPWASPRILGARNTILGMTSAVLFSASVVANSVLIPNFLLNVAHLRPEQFGGLLLLWVALPLLGTSALGVWLLRRVDFRLVIMLGFAHFAAASLWATQLTAAWRMADFIPVALLQSVGLGITFTAIVVGNFTSIRPDQGASFAAYIQILRLVAVQFGVALITTLLRVREQLHSHLLGLHLPRDSAEVTQALAGRGLAGLAASVQQQANVLAFIDGFELTFLVSLAGILVAGAMKPAPKGPLTSRV